MKRNEAFVLLDRLSPPFATDIKTEKKETDGLNLVRDLFCGEHRAHDDTDTPHTIDPLPSPHTLE
jgi:hypothetical protein